MFKREELQELTQVPGEEIVYLKTEIKKFLFGIKIYNSRFLQQMQLVEDMNTNNRMPIQGFSLGTNLIKVGEE